MSFYRSRETGEPVEAMQFVGRADLDLVGTGHDESEFAWAQEAFDQGILERNAFHTSLIVNFRGGSYGLAIGDWVIRKRGGEITHCRGDRFAERYEPV